METPLKERLVGAAVLVVVVVLVLPELFTGRAARPPPAVAHDAGGVPLRTHQFDLGSESTPAPPATQEATPSAPPAAAPEPVAVIPPPEPASASPDAPPSGIPSARPSSPPAAARPAPAVVAPPAAAAPRVTAPSAAMPPKPTMDQGASGWVVQLGSFATRTNAEKLVGQLRAKGYRAFTLPYTASGKTLHRVRVGPEQDRDRADALARRLKGDGYPGTVAPHP